MPTPKEHISYSQLVKYERCPRCYKLEYFDGVKAVENRPMIFGRFVHEVIRLCNRQVMKYKNKDDLGVEEIKAIYEKESKKVALNFVEYNKGWDMVLDHTERVFKAKSELFKVEYELTCELTYKEQKIILLGILDRLDLVQGGLKIVEYKTGERLPSHEEVEEELQLNIYTYLIHKAFPEYDPLWTSYYSLGLKKEVKVLKDVTKLDAMEDYLIEVWQKIENDKKFEPRLNNKCYWCPARTTCELYQKKYKERYGELQVSDATGIVKRYKELKAMSKNVEAEKKAIEELVKNKLSDSENLEDDETVLSLKLCHREGYEVKVNATDYQQILQTKKVLDKGKKKE